MIINTVISDINGYYAEWHYMAAPDYYTKLNDIDEIDFVNEENYEVKLYDNDEINFDNYEKYYVMR